jgi:hypothetical protein
MTSIRTSRHAYLRPHINPPNRSTQVNRHSALLTLINTMIDVQGQKGKRQGEIAKEVWPDARQGNMLSNIKAGTNDLPMDKVVPLARALGVEPVVMIELWFQQYQPEMWQIISENFVARDGRR